MVDINGRRDIPVVHRCGHLPLQRAPQQMLNPVKALGQLEPEQPY